MIQTHAHVARMRDDRPVPSHGAKFATTFDEVKQNVEPQLHVLVDACVSTLSRPSSAAATTAIQSECWSLLLGRSPTDLVGVSPTGSGKTLAFLLPAFASLLTVGSTEKKAVQPEPEAAAAADVATDPAASQASAKARAEAAMRVTATSAFAEAVKSGMSKDQAKEVARAKAKAAYKEALKMSGSSSSTSSSSSASSSREAPKPTDTPKNHADRGVVVASDVVEPGVLVLAPTRELCLQIFAVCESIVESLAASLGPEPDAVSTRNLASIACGCVVGGVDFVRQRQALLGQRPRLVVATPGRLLSQCGVVPASSKARASAAEERGEASAGGGVPTEHLPGRGSIAARRRLAERLMREGRMAAQPATAAATPSRGDEDDANALACAGTTAAALSLHRVEMLVLDEADRLLDLGFESDLREALALLSRPTAGAGTGSGSAPNGTPALRAHSRRTLLFSATFSPPIRALAADLLEPSALRITVDRPPKLAGAAANGQAALLASSSGGEGGGSNADELTSSASVAQRFELHRGKGAKGTIRRRLLVLLGDLLGDGGSSKEGGEGKGSKEGSEEDEEEEESTEEEDDDDEEEEEEGEGEGATVQALASGVQTESRCAADAIDIGDAEAAATIGAEDTRPRVVVFARYKLEARQLADFLAAKGHAAVALHGDMQLKARTEAMQAFRLGTARVLVATDVAARGLDVRHVVAVINTSLGTSIENYVHRVGRCGRAGATGVATTFLVDGDELMAPSLVALLERSRQNVPPELRALARKEEARNANATSASGFAEEEDDDDDERRAQVANREKQMARQRAKKAAGHDRRRR